MMLFVIYIYLTSLVSGENEDKTVHQKPDNLILNNGETSEIKCSHQIPNYDRLLWYKQSRNKEITFMGYLIGEMGYPEEPFLNKIRIQGDSNKFKGSLTLLNVTSENTSVYLCAAYYTAAPNVFVSFKNIQ
ncbi:hypothetical protein DNTS_014419 [Danionella cerebrum]|uniref:Ig-like domain-containing protein n=1 Tax=Danionella cerebrum TaxID=2873325 RepID=A0A553MXJ2_9TELE|nr:hypothetical protein DNTS_014419 [Danionella translucida]